MELNRILVPLLAASFLQASCVSANETGDRLPEDEIIYFVLPDRFENGDHANDRGGIHGDRLDHGFDPKHKGFYQGGDLIGLTKRLDYIQGLGVTAIWLTPIFENKPVQGPQGNESSGYHGYWITDFLNVDPHLGSREDFKAFVDAAHARGMKVYMDIITNHTADVIKNAECHGPDAPAEYRKSFTCPYRSEGEYPYTTVGGPEGEPINEGFLGTDANHQSAENYARLTNSNYAYTPYVQESEKSAKNPAWLNNVTLYHNRGDTYWEGKSAVIGDFAGLDDLMTSNPRVVQGFIDIYKQWITDFRVDGFRIDTAKHVNPEFWQQFAPAILDHAKAEGIENFHMFGEVYEFEPAHLAKFTTDAGLPTVLDFAFQGTVRAMVANGQPSKALERLFGADAVYADGFETAKQLPTFLGNHDMGRFSMFVREARKGISDEELRQRVLLGHAMMMFSRGVPTIYYGDEQGFVSDGGDQSARETMFPSVTEVFIDNDLIATDATVADANFDTSHSIYRALAEMAQVRQAEAALRRGTQLVRHSEHDGEAFVMSRFAPDDSREIVVAFNTGMKDREVSFAVDGRTREWQSLMGSCPAVSPAPGTYRIEIPALGYVVCKSEY